MASFPELSKTQECVVKCVSVIPSNERINHLHELMWFFLLKSPSIVYLERNVRIPCFVNTYQVRGSESKPIQVFPIMNKLF